MDEAFTDSFDILTTNIVRWMESRGFKKADYNKVHKIHSSHDFSHSLLYHLQPLFSPLHVAIQFDDIYKVKYLIEDCQANIEIHDWVSPAIVQCNIN